jgi:hypothetical protein
MRTSIFTAGGIAVLAMAAVATSGVAVAAPLTRSSCWTSRTDTGSTRTMCFSGAPRATMHNRNQVGNSNEWSTCKWTGTYFRKGDKVTVSFAQGSGRCSNGAASPQYSVVCDFTGENLDCDGSSIVNGRTYEVHLRFE